MRSEPFWLEPDYVVELNAAAVEDTNEPHLLRDRGLLESACDVPRNWWSYELETEPRFLAGVLMLAIARNHPFEQGNKRAAFAAAQSFLHLNGLRLIVPDDVDVAALIVGVIERKADEDVFLDLLGECVWPLEN